ncbi:MAG: helix-turn-helix transcriptional regulator [Clostridia bacterium]|nr:helix-turn-helix transcriptional regulator [Clostridia bacterium]MBQ8743505.1 helix-turn-helix transcriptional regulator [Clostridia bacterium]
MSLSANIKRLRLEKNLTQEQLATKLGVSAQAVSKWETSETYPDGALLVPLANELDVSLDELFGNDSVTMADISGKIMKLIHNTEAKERFNVSRDITWQIERGLFNCRMEIEKKYDPNEIKNQKNASYILDDNGFTIVSNGKEPFFSVFPEPAEGYGHFLNDKDDMQKIFAALSHTDTMNALIYLYHKTENYVFESSVLEKDCNIPGDKIESVLADLLLLKVMWKQNLIINGEERTLFGELFLYSDLKCHISLIMTFAQLFYYLFVNYE